MLSAVRFYYLPYPNCPGIPLTPILLNWVAFNWFYCEGKKGLLTFGFIDPTVPWEEDESYDNFPERHVLAWLYKFVKYIMRHSFIDGS
jgi:hypothetical protein